MSELLNQGETDGTQTGSVGNSVGNSVYDDLILTAFPDYLDVRTGAVGIKNMNMYRQTNLKHYNMAEHVNALQDAVMAIQRALGANVQVPLKPKDAEGNEISPSDPNYAQAMLAIKQSSTVKERLDVMEGFDWFSIFDKRYGGPNWLFNEQSTTNPTIQQHRHLGTGNGMPEKIVLTDEVQGKLKKGNLDLSKTSNGVTGSDIYVDTNSSQKLSSALNDKISETTGGTITQSATLTNYGKTNTRYNREFDYKDATVGNVSDAKTLLGRAAESPTTTSATLLNENLTGMYFGRYVAIVRLSCSSLTSSNVVEIEAADSSTNGTISRVILSGSDFDSSNEYKTFYLVFNHEGKTKIQVNKLATSSSARIRFDYAIVEPVHPAVFDR